MMKFLFRDTKFAMLLVCLLAVMALSIQGVSATTYTYTFQGPFYLSGSIDTSDTVRCNIIWSDLTTSQVSLSNSNFSQIITHGTYIREISWNASDVGNYTSIMVLPPATTTNIPINIYIPNPNMPYFMYTFPVTAFVPLTHGYLSVNINAAGLSNTMAEQVSLDAAGIPAFVMQQFQTYTLTFTCDEGVYSQQFSAQNIQSNTLEVLAGAFISNTTGTTSISATRPTQTTLNIYYADPNSTTTSLNVVVIHKNGVTDIVDYNDTKVTNVYNATVTVDGSTDYYVAITPTQSGTQSTYKYALSALVIPTNPFNGLFNFLGNWPAGLDPAQLFAAGIIMCCLAIGSKWSAGFSCLCAWVMAGILYVLGWFTMSIPMFAFAGVFSLIVVLVEAKEQSRDA
jgi:hypothetical protein